LFHFFTIRWL